MHSISTSPPQIPSLLPIKTALGPATGALNFSSKGTCLNPQTERAIVAVLNTNTDKDTIATIFYNAFEYGYKNELNLIIKSRCRGFLTEQNLAELNLAGNLTDRGILFTLIGQTFEMTAAPSTSYIEDQTAKEIDLSLSQLGLPKVINAMILEKSSVPLKFDQFSIAHYAGIFTTPGNLAFKRQFIATAIRDQQQHYLRQLFTEIQLEIIGPTTTSVRCVNLVSVDLSRLDLSGIKFAFCDLSNANLFEARLNECFFRRAILNGVRLNGKFLEAGDFQGADLHGARFTGVLQAKFDQFKGAILNNVALIDFSCASDLVYDFSGATLNNSSLNRSTNIALNFTGATLVNVDLSAMYQPKLCFKNAKLINVNLSRNCLRECDFEGATLINVDWTDCDFTGAKFGGGVTELSARLLD